MIRTLRGNNGSYAGLGSIQIQPSPADSIEYQTQQQTSKEQGSYSNGAVPARQATIPVPVLLHSTGSLSQMREPHLSDIVSMMVGDPTFVFPMGSQTNHIVPTFALSLDAGKTYDPRQNQDHPTTTTKFTPFELLTGISRERPEVIMLTNFLPLFHKDASKFHSIHTNKAEAAGFRPLMTDSGRYLDAQFHLRAISSHHVQEHVRRIRKRYPTVDQHLKKRTDAFGDGVRRLKDDATFLLNAVRILEDDKKRLDLRNDAFLIKDPATVARYISKNFSQLRLSTSVNKHVDLVEVLVKLGTRHAFDFRDCMHDLGYVQSNVQDVFSSSKIWLQTLYELKQALQNHTLQLLDIDPTYQRHDNSPSNITKAPVKYFGIAPTVPALPPMAELIDLPVAGASQAINTLQTAFTSIYQNAYFKSEEARIAALAHLVSREYRYSYGLSLPPVQQALSRFYGFTVAPRGNSTLFDAVIGDFGNNISDFPATQDKSLAGVSQARPERDVGVLTFESKFVEGDTGTLSPGGEYFFDRVLEHATAQAFDTSGCDELLKLSEDQLNQLLVIVDGFNLLMLPTQFDPRHHGSARDVENNFLGHPSDLVRDLASQLINTTTGKVLENIEHDRLGAVYARARNDARLKTILFLYTVSKISRAYGTNVQFLNSSQHHDNTPLVDNLIDRLVSSLEASVPESRSTVQLVTQHSHPPALNTAAMTGDSIKHALKAGTPMTAVIEQFMSGVIDWFRNKTSSMHDGHTRYGGYLDTVIMMVAFDLAITMVARYSDQQIVGKHRGLSGFSQGQTTYAISQASTNHAHSYNDVVQRQNREGDMHRQMIVTFANALLVVSGMARSTSNYFKGSAAHQKLSDIVKGLGGDVKMLRLLLTEQQIMLLASTVEDLVTAHQHGGQPTTRDRSPAHSSYRASSPAPAKEVILLDESDVPPEMEQAVLGYFSSAEYAGQRGTNKRILTVGIPHGFTQLLKQKVSVQSSKRATFSEKRDDIVQVTVYKIDMQNTEIVYRPVRYLFELSRFPTRYTTAHWLPLRDQPTIADVINSIPTQNFSQGFDVAVKTSTAIGVEYASTAIAGQHGVQHAHAAFEGPAYAFLTAAQKAQILHNHIVSQLLEVYIKLMTGVNVAEYAYHIVETPPLADPELMTMLTQHTLAHLAEAVAAQNQTSSAQEDAPPAGGILFSSTATQRSNVQAGTRADRSQTDPIFSNPAGIAGNVQHEAQFRSTSQQIPATRTLEQQSAVGSTDSSLDALSHRHVVAAVTSLRTVAKIGNSMSHLTGADAYNYRVLCPKQFDRVFNIIIDPRDFDIDVKQTLHTPYGRQALDLLIKHGEVVPSDTPVYLEQYGYKSWQSLLTESVLEGRRPPQGRFFPNINNFKFRERDRTQGDLVADKYFITIETLEESDDT